MIKMFKKLTFQLLIVQALACLIMGPAQGAFIASAFTRAKTALCQAAHNYVEGLRKDLSLEDIINTLPSEYYSLADDRDYRKKTPKIRPAPLINKTNYCWHNAKRQLVYAALTAYPKLYTHISEETYNFFQQYKHCAETGTSFDRGQVTDELDEIIRIGGITIDHRKLYSLTQKINQNPPRIIYVEDSTQIPGNTTLLLRGGIRYKLKGITTWLSVPNAQLYPRWSRYTHFVAHIKLYDTWFHCSDDTVEELGSSYKKAQEHLKTVGEIINHGLLYIRQG